MKNTEHYQNKQAIEEQKFNAFAQKKNITNYKHTPLSCSYDVKMLSGFTYIIAETKVRTDFNINFFNNNGAYLELKKIEGMFKAKESIKNEKSIDVEMYYFNFTLDGLQIFDLKEPWQYKFDWQYLPKNNIEKHIKEWKLVTPLFFPIETIYYK